MVKLPVPLQRFYFIATICDPRQKGLTFPGVTANVRELALEWFEAEYKSLWDTSDSPHTPEAVPLPQPPPAPQAPVATSVGTSFASFMSQMVHVHVSPPKPTVANVTCEVQMYLL